MQWNPARGVRILLELQATDPEGGASYRGALLTPRARGDFAVTIGPRGEVSVAPTDAPSAAAVPLPASVQELLRAIARTVGRHALAAIPPAWPRRVLRWRKLPEK